ncbi:MAG: hypothetical protein AAGH68_10230 [Pseudomonadota bacterium]
MSIFDPTRWASLCVALMCLAVLANPSIASGNDSKKKAIKKDFAAHGDVSCAQERGEALGLCKASVARGTDGTATVVVRFSNGFARKLYFEERRFISASATMSGVGRDTDWAREGGVHLIRVDDQRYELPDAFVFGD